ncbi:MAG TPA: histidinol phosphatase, partial [Acidimicrobiia bacterium]|nr:histidinol phosphatase [Acidimicrobiia bacterium]
EAGGTFTALDGRAVVDGGDALASNGLLHDAVRSLLRPEGF